MIFSAEFSKGFVRQENVAKKVSAASGDRAARRAKKQTSAVPGVGISGREEGSVWFQSVVGVRSVKSRAWTFRLVEKARIGKDGAASAVETRPNQSLEPTSMLGTSAAEPPRVPSTLVAHL